MKQFSSVLSWMVLLVAAGGLCAQTVSTDKTSLSFSGLVGGAAVSQPLTITSSGGSVTFFIFPNQPWLRVNPQSGTTPMAVTVMADPTGLAAGTYNTTLSVFGGPSSSVSVQVSFTVSTIGVDPQSWQFPYTIGGAVPGVKSFTLSGPSTSFTAAASTTSGGNWLQVVPTSGTSPGAVTAILNPAIVPGLSAGTYSGAITITPTSGSSITPVTVAVTLTVTPAPPVTVNPASLVFNFQTGQTPPSTQNLTISTTPGQLMNFGFTATNDANPAGKIWITMNPSSGAIPTSGSTQVTVAVDTANLPPNTYNGKMTLFTPGGAPTQQDIPVKLLISSLPLLNVPGAALSFAYQLGGAVPAAQNVTCTATSGALPFTTSVSSGATWLSVPANGTTPAPFAVTVNPAGLPPGTYSATITVTGTGAGNGPQQIPVTLKITNDPMIAASAASLAFPYQIAQALPSPQNIKMTSSTGAPLNYTASATTATCGNSWLVLSGTTSGTTSDSFTVSVSLTGLSAGTCSGTISIAATNPSTGAAAINSPMTIPVTLYVSNTPLLVATPPPPFTFSVQQGAQAPAPQTINLNSTSPTDQVNFRVTFTTDTGGNWLFVGPLSGATPNTATISVIPALLSAGVYTGSVTISATGSGGVALANSPIVLPITLQVTAGNLTLSPTALSFTQTLGGSAPAAQNVTIGSTGQPLTYTAVAANTGPVSWLSVTPVGGTTSSNPAISASVDGSKLTPGTYQGAITVTAPGAGNSPATVSVTLTVTAGTIAAAPSSLTFTQVAGGSAPASQNVSVSGTPGPISFSVTTSTNSGGTWLAATPQSGTTPGTVQVAVGASGLAANTYTGTITITAAGATGSPINIPVTLNVLPPSTLTASPLTLNFSYTIGLATPQGQTVQLTSTGGSVPFTVTTQVTGAGNWLQVNPANASTPNVLAVSVSPQALAAGNYSGTIAINSPNSLAPVSVTVNLTVIAIPPPVVRAIGNAASYATGAISPGENIVIFGANVGPSDLTKGHLTGAGTVDTVVANTRVLFDGTPAPVIYVSATQTSVMVPYEVAGRSTTAIRVEVQGVQSDPLTYNVAAAAPGIYTLNQAGTGPGAILNQDGVTVNGPSALAAKGSVVAVYMTGEGQTTPAGANGVITPADGTGLKKPVQTVTATVGGVPATVQYYGSAPGIVSGVMQVNVQIPAAAPSGAAVPLVISVGPTSTQAGVTVAIAAQ